MSRITRSYLNRKMRLGKVDSALLFLSSTVGTIFAVIRALVSGAAGLWYAAPLLLLGVVLPLYFGYWRGGIVRSSALDRYRGWIFFFVGIGFYALNGLLAGLESAGLLATNGLGLAFVGVLIIAPLIVIGYKFEGSFLRVVGYEKTPVSRECLTTTKLAAFMLGASSLFVVDSLSNGYSFSDNGYTLTLLPVFFGVTGIISLWRSEGYWRLATFGYTEQLVKPRLLFGRKISEWWGFGASLIGLAVLVVIGYGLVQPLTLSTFIILMSLGIFLSSIGVLMMTLFSQRKRWVARQSA